MSQITANYYNQKSLSYGISGLRRQRIFSLIGPIRGKTVLDVGCATGYVGGTLKRMGNTVIGIDISASAVKKAQKVLDRVYCLDIETDPFPFRQRFDLIILAEVLEHLFQPNKVVRKLMKYLKPSGQLIITTPNISFFVHRLNFILGKFEYDNQGVFDESHVHFFNYKSLRQLFKACNLRILKEEHVIFPQTLRHLFKHWPNLCAYQLIVSVKPLHR